MARRVLLKVSGEALGGDTGSGLCADSLARLTQQVSRASSHVQIAIVVGAGNICRGQDWSDTDLPQPLADAIGMAATHVNALAIHARLLLDGVTSQVMGAGSPVPQVALFDSMEGRALLEKGTVLVLSGGTGNPFFTTDTAAALRAAEMSCDALMKGTNVDGVYSADPKLDPAAERFDRLSYIDVLAKDLKVMDASAVSLSRENGIPIVVFSIQTSGGFMNVLRGTGDSTVVSD